MKVSIPRTIGAAERKLNLLGELATATEWERAAIVAAYVEPRAGQGRRTSGSSAGSWESPTEFAKRGIHGLTSHHTVKLYHDAWFNIYDEDGNVVGQRERPVAGKSVEVPTDPWPPTRTGTDGYESDEGVDKTLDKMISKHGADKVAGKLANKAPASVGKQAAKPSVAKSIVHDKAATKSVIRQQNAKTKRTIKRRDPSVADEINDVLGTEQQLTDAMTTSSHFNKMRQLLGLMNNLWIDGTKKQAFKPVDRHFLGTDVLRWRELLEEFAAFVEADDDPYDAVTVIRKERVDITDRELDDLELSDGDSIDAGIEDLERFANEGV